MNKRGKATVVSAVLVTSLMGATLAGAEAIPKKWKSLDVPGLTAEAKKLKKRPPFAPGDIDLLAKYVAQRYASASASGKLDIKKWLTLASVLSERLPAKTREAMAKEIQAKLVPNQDAIVKLSYQDCRTIAWALSRLGSKQGPVVLATWSEKTTALQRGKPRDLLSLAHALREIGDVGKKARARVAGHIEGKYLAEAALAKLGPKDCWLVADALRRLDSKQAANVLPLRVEKNDTWQSWPPSSLAYLAQQLSRLGDAGKKARARLASYIEGKYLAEATLAKLAPKDCGHIADALRTLGSKQAAATLAVWVEKSDAWRAWRLLRLSWLVEDVSKLGDAGKKARARLIGHFEKERLAHPKGIRSGSLGEWNRIVSSLVKYLSKEARVAWADRLYSEFVADMTLPGVAWRLGVILDKLDYKNRGATAARIVEKTDTWQSWKLGGLVGLASELSKAGDVGKNARARLISHVETKCLADAKTIRAASMRDWHLIVGSLATHLSKEARVAWGEKLYSAFADDVAQPGKSKALENLLVKLDYKKPGAIAATIVEKTDTWKLWKPDGLADLGMRLPAGDKGKAARARLVSHIEAKYLKDNAAVTSATCGQWWDFAKCFAKTLPPESRKRWIAKLRAAYVKDAKVFTKLSSGEVLALSKALNLLGDANSSRIVNDWLSAKP